MRVLLVKLRHIGDALLMTPTIQALKNANPGIAIDVVVRQGTEGILSGCSSIRKIYTTASPEKSKRSHMSWLDALRLQMKIRAEKYDVAIELGNNQRGRTLVALSGAGKRCANAHLYPIRWPLKPMLTHLGKSNWSLIHRVEADFLNAKDFMELPQQGAGTLVFEKDRTVAPPLEISTDKPLVIFHPVTRWKRKRWSDDHWVSAGRALISKNHQIIISVGPDPEEVALGLQLAQAIGPGCTSTEGKTNWNHLAWLLYHARLFVGVDTAAMHLAAATGCPTVALFGPDSGAHNWSPWQTPHRIVHFNSDDASTVHEVLTAASHFLDLAPHNS